MSGVNTVRILKEDLLKEVARPAGDGRSEKILDILKSLDKIDMNIAILTEVRLNNGELCKMLAGKMYMRPRDTVRSCSYIFMGCCILGELLLMIFIIGGWCAR